MVAGGAPVGTPTIETGSYVGNGTYGSGNPVSITFDRTPLFVWISTRNITANTGQTTYGSACFNCLPLNDSFSARGWMGDMVSSSSGLHADSPFYVKLDGTTLSWYNSSSSYASGANQMNKNKVTYYYFAITI